MMSTWKTPWIMAALVVGVSFVLTVGAASAHIVEQCTSDIEAYCSQVKLGNGRLYACLYAHEDKLSDACDVASQGVSDQIDAFFERLRYVVQQCREDVRAHCTIDFHKKIRGTVKLQKASR